MAHIDLPPGLPGIRGPMAFRPETARPLSDLANVLLHGPSTLSRAEREMIAAHVSERNQCSYCRDSHAAIAVAHCGDEALVASVTREGERAAVSPKLQALLAIAARVQEGGKNVRAEDVARARAEGANDLEIHDTVLIAAAFCMFNRYVDGLATFTPTDPASYRERAAAGARDGYGAVLKTVGVEVSSADE
ncbi:MAG: peroxidase-related enzyme [Vicinamibacteria bacterium]